MITKNDSIYYKNLNIPLIEEWIEALESGKYEQGRGTLKDLNNRFCCLGVLSDLVKDKVSGRWENEIFRCFLDNDSTESKSGHLVSTIINIVGCVREWFEIPISILTKEEKYKILLNGNTIDLTKLNDNGFTFKEIADILRRLIKLKEEYMCNIECAENK